MSDRKPPKDSDLNPDLRAKTDETYGPDQQGRDPMETISSTGKEGREWPVVWIVVAILCVLISLFIFIA
ncbi:hypothetical protein [Microbulbifer agarilyticus]|uniref:hypothetical protein n=1 Tax=Microbulbifer agarilyticus TaxID=260552 RepID=UPI001CD433C6|nr:hypothetical protein [Microbulbifer agarilyticus]MCA0892494.1 hypothetical protein [Microbulbifer agarilyticus]